MPHGHPSHSHKSPKPPHTDPEADEDGDDDNADDNDDDDDGRSDDDSHPAATPMVIPSATVSHPLPSMTADLENPTNKQTESEAVRADRANKIIGIAVGLGCVVIGAAGLSGIVIARKRDKARQVVLDDGELQTRWRPQSFLAVVTTAVSRAQQACQRDNSIKSNGSSESKHRRRQQASEGVTAV
ncbi:hypothetical protein BGW37DRAFT_503832 [Umbelopsis sp. PMI_123]|nr:hypothetical protein BGW37DRAFT_503832 [Umbelopsis sp. PMI_123]